MKKYMNIVLLGLSGLLPAMCVGAACWAPVPKTSQITFSINQAGAPLQGTFGDYDGLICIDPANGKNDRIRVQIRTASVNTQLPELDDALRGADFFDSPRWPEALFESHSIRALGQSHYLVQGKLTLRDVTREISVPFTFQIHADGTAMLSGHLGLQRLDYHIGLGQWSDTRWVGNQVDITFSVALRPLSADQH